jgi:hypothetical protein
MLRARRVAAHALALLALSGCGGGDDGDDGEAAERPEWRGPVQEDGGGMPVEDFNRYLAEGAEIGEHPLAAAAAFVGGARGEPVEGEGPQTTFAEEPGGAEGERVVVATVDGLLDDSVRSVRYVLRFEADGADAWRLASAEWSQRCHEGRGHQGFSPEPCL